MAPKDLLLKSTILLPRYSLRWILFWILVILVSAVKQILFKLTKKILLWHSCPYWVCVTPDHRCIFYGFVCYNSVYFSNKNQTGLFRKPFTAFFFSFVVKYFYYDISPSKQFKQYACLKQAYCLNCLFCQIKILTCSQNYKWELYKINSTLCILL